MLIQLAEFPMLRASAKTHTDVPLSANHAHLILRSVTNTSDQNSPPKGPHPRVYCKPAAASSKKVQTSHELEALRVGLSRSALRPVGIAGMVSELATCVCMSNHSCRSISSVRSLSFCPSARPAAEVTLTCVVGSELLTAQQMLMVMLCDGGCQLIEDRLLQVLELPLNMEAFRVLAVIRPTICWTLDPVSCHISSAKRPRGT
jgi:hypothetical protein